MLAFAAKVVTSYKANVDDHVKSLDKLKGAEKDRAESSIEANKKVSEALAQTKDGIELLAKGIEFGKEMFAAYAEHSKLAAATASVDFEKLTKASAGLKTQTELMKDAAVLQAGAFKLSGDQMAIVEKAMLSYSRKGLDAQKVHEALLHAVTALKTDGLDDLGVHIDKTGLEMEKSKDRAELFRRVMEKLKTETKGVSDAQQTEAERTTAAGVAFENAVEKMKTSLGKLVVALTPLVEKIGTLAGYVADLGDKNVGGRAQYMIGKRINDTFTSRGLPAPIPFLADVDEKVGAGAQAMTEAEQAYAAAMKTERLRQYYARGGRSKDWASSIMAGDEPGYIEMPPVDATKPFAGSKALAEAAAREKEIQAELDKIFKPYWERTSESHEDYVKRLELAQQRAELKANPYGRLAGDEGGADYGRMALGLAGAGGIDYGKVALGAGRFQNDAGIEYDITKSDAITKALKDTANERLTESWLKRLEDLKKQGEVGSRTGTILEKLIGTTDQWQIYTNLAQGFFNAFGAGYEAMVTGTQSFGKAFKHAIGDALLASGKQMQIEALKEGAMGLASLALGPIGGVSAAGHFAAAAAFEAGAIVAGVAAHELGAGASSAHAGGSTVGGRGAAPTLGGGDNGPAYQGQKIIYVIGDNFGDTTPRERVGTFKKRYQEAFGDAGVMEG
jgi:hypothetical protein